MNTTRKLDLYKLHKDEYVTPKKPVLVNIKPAHYLAISGQGAPGGKRFSPPASERFTPSHSPSR